MINASDYCICDYWSECGSERWNGELGVPMWHNTFGHSSTYSGLQKCCNVLQFQIVCSVALYDMEITLSIIERK
jgi:hypothetical protein